MAESQGPPGREDHFFVDIHCHILPGVDDGARNLEESAAMARIAARSGTRSIIATPHHIPRSPLSAADEAAKRAKQLMRVFEWAEILIEVHPGQENNARENLIERLDNKEAVPLNGTSYVLVEPPFRTYPDYLDRLLHSLVERGMTPVVAHPERNIQVQQDPGLGIKWVEDGALLQLNTGSVLGSYGGPARDAAVALLAREGAHVLASDAHSNSGRFVPNMREGFDAVAQVIGESAAWRLVRDNPLKILTGVKIDPRGSARPSPV